MCFRKSLTIAVLCGIAAFAGAQDNLRALLLGDLKLRAATLAADPWHYTVPVEDLLADQDPRIRKAAAIGLREMDWPKEARMDDESDGHATLRKYVIRDLAGAALDKDPRVSDEAILSMVVLQRVRYWGEHGEAWQRRSELEPLVSLGERAVPILVQVLDKDSTWDYSVQAAAAKALVAIHPKTALPTLLDLIHRTDGSLLDFAINGATSYNDRRVVPALSSRIADDVPHFSVTHSAYALMKMKYSVVPELLREFDAIRDPNAKFEVLQVLGFKKDRAALPTLWGCLSDEDGYIRTGAAEALGGFGDRKSIALLKTACLDPIWQVRAFACQSLIQLRARSAFTEVARCLSDTNQEVGFLSEYGLEKDRRHAQEFLAFVRRRPQLQRTLESSPSFKELKAWLDALAWSSQPPKYRRTANELLAKFKDRDEWDTLSALCRTGDRRAVLPALEFIRQERIGTESVIDELDNLHDPRVVPVLRDALKSEDSRIASHAAMMLGKLGDADSMPDLIRASQSDDEDTAKAAKEAMHQIRNQEWDRRD